MWWQGTIKERESKGILQSIVSGCVCVCESTGILQSVVNGYVLSLIHI